MAETAPIWTVLLPPRAEGGHEKALIGWLQDAQRLHGLRLRLLCADPPLLQRARAAGLAAELLAQPQSRMAWLRLLRGLPAGSPLLLAPGGMYAQAWLLTAAWLMGHRCWVYVPNSVCAAQAAYRWARWRDLALRPGLGRIAGWITVSEDHAQGLRRDWRIKAPVHVLPGQALVDEERPAAPESLANGGLRIALVGRLDLRQKGLDWLADAVLAQGDARDRWLVQGQGDGEAWLRQCCERSAGRLSLRAYAPLVEALAVSDLLLLSSRYEGVPLVALEATALGWPVVASRQSGLNGLLPACSLYEFGDWHGLEQALQTLREPTARQAALAYAQQRLRDLHGQPVYHRALQRVVKAMGRSARSGPPQ
jgi:glycosyltransferase involved in cell wall biosynthesis